ncbi:hypothetical protein [Flavobacterium sp.]|jgi:hypothetical protein|uniref:hypothetical protein n=1 Tax=Flavobacterium sp. TaxID=239 RepID=UPI0037C115F7
MLQQEKTRKEVALDSQTLALLTAMAEKEGRKLKNFMEQVLKEKASTFEISDAYKNEMDEILTKHKKGQNQYISEENFFSKINRK